MDEKKCSKCGETKPLDEFHRDRSNADGRRSPCRQCKREESAVRTRMREAEMASARREARAAAEKECSNCRKIKPRDGFAKNAQRKDGLNGWCKDCLRAWRDSNKERLAAKKADYYYANRSTILAYHKAWREENADELRERKAKWREENRDAIRAHAKANPHVMWGGGYRKRARSYGFPVVEDRFTKADVIDRYGDSCAYCETAPFEELDHFIPVKDGGPHTLDNVRPTCVTCNRVKNDRPGDEWLAEQAELDDLTEDELDDLIDAEIERWTK